MSIAFRFVALVAGLAGAASAVRAQADPAAAPASRLSAPPPPWQLVAAKPGIVVALDSSRIVAEPDGVQRVRVRIEYAEPMVLPQNPRITWTRMDATHLVDCARGRGLDVDMTVFDATGMEITSLTWDGVEWTAFERHGLGVGFWRPLCAVLGTRGTR